MISGEGIRGVVFFGGYLGFATLSYIGAKDALIDATNDGTGSKGLTTIFLGLAGVVLVDIWSAVDAVQVAKVNNLVFRDKNKTAVNLQIQPYINGTSYLLTGTVQTGITLKISF